MTYVYECQSCKDLSEIEQHHDEEPLSECPLCKGELKRIMQVTVINFKGEGFYSTDNT